MKRKNKKTPYIIATAIIGIIGLLDAVIPDGAEDTSRSLNSETNYSSVVDSDIRANESIDRSITYIEDISDVDSSEIENTSEKSNEYSDFSKSLVETDPQLIPDYSGFDSIVLNSNQPMFNQYDYDNLKGQWFTPLDSLGRCGSAIAMIDRSMMPTEERGYIGNVEPSGWHTVKYPDLISDLYLYNRCHLIGYALTGENANVLNLITGTRYFNISIMYEYERKVIDILENTDNHVLYRVTPLFYDNDLVARGVEIEAFSVEDAGQSVCFNVFCYNIQPGIGIDYTTGDSWVE